MKRKHYNICITLPPSCETQQMTTRRLPDAGFQGKPAATYLSLTMKFSGPAVKQLFNGKRVSVFHCHVLSTRKGEWNLWNTILIFGKDTLLGQ